MGGPKHLLEIDGRPMLARTVEALARSRAGQVAVVLRPGDQAGAALAAALGATVHWAEPPEDGRAASVRAAAASVSPAAAGLLIALADQPWLETVDFERLLGAFESDPSGIVRARYAGEPGTPVLFARAYLPELAALEAGQGGRAVIARHPSDVRDVDLDPERGRDVDRPDDLDPSAR